MVIGGSVIGGFKGGYQEFRLWLIWFLQRCASGALPHKVYRAIYPYIDLPSVTRAVLQRPFGVVVLHILMIFNKGSGFC